MAGANLNSVTECIVYMFRVAGGDDRWGVGVVFDPVQVHKEICLTQ